MFNFIINLVTKLVTNSVINLVTKFNLNNNIIKFFHSKFQNKNNIAEHFREMFTQNDPKMDVFFYQLGLRKTIPITDFLYLVYIKSLIRDGKIKKLVIFPTVFKSGVSQSNYEEFSKNIKRVVDFPNIEIIDPFKDTYFYSDDLASDDFIEALKYIGSKKFFNYLQDSFRIRISSISDINKHRCDDKIMHIFINIYKSWCMVNYIKKHIDLSKQVKISAIIWEWEVDKLGVIKHYAVDNKQVNFYPVLGRTQRLDNGTVISDTENETICIFDDSKSIINKAYAFIPFLKKYNLLLETVLLEHDKIDRKAIRADGKNQLQSYKASNSEINNAGKETDDFFLFLGLIYKIRSIYGIEDENT